jgi:hypothetical protein
MSRFIEANPHKGPEGKNPWIELDGDRIGDSEVIIDLLKSAMQFGWMNGSPRSRLGDALCDPAA